MIAYIVAFICLCAQSGFAKNYCVDASNGNDTNAGNTPEFCWKSIAKVNKSSFNPGDNIYFKRGEIWEETLIVSSSGAEGCPITFGAYGDGDNPRIKCTNTFSDWVLEVDQSPLKVFKGTMPGIKNSWGAMKNGLRVPQYYGYKVKGSEWSAPKNVAQIKNGFFFSKLNRGVFFFRHDAGNPKEMEIGARKYGIYIANKKYIIIDSIDVYGPGGRSDKGSSTGFAQIVIDSSDNVIIKNNTLSYHDSGGAFIKNGSTNCIYQNVTSYGHQSTGLYFYQAGEGNKAINCMVYKCGNLLTDHGDMGLIGVWKTPGVLIDGCYVHDNGHFNMSKIDAGISLVQSPDGHVNRCLIKNTGGTGLQFAENSDCGILSYCVINGWGLYGQTIIKKSHIEGIRIGGGYTTSTLINCKIYNNLLIHGGNTPGNWAAMRIANRVNGGLQVKNNIFYNNKGVYEIYAESKDDFKNWVFSNNLFYRTHGIAINWNNNEYDYKHILGNNKGCYSYDQKQELNSITADPKLLGNYMGIMSDSPCIDNGVNVNLSTDYHGNSVPIGEGVDIGPFEYR